MDRMMIPFWRRWLLAEDPGSGNPGGDGGGQPASDSGGDGGNEPDDLKEPAYFSQLPQEKAKSDAYKALYRYQSIDALGDALLAAQEENGRLKANQPDERSIHVPKKGDEEGIKAFAKKLGVPDEPGGYDFSSLAEAEKGSPELVQAVRKGCRRMLLTGKQGKAVADMISAWDRARDIKAAIDAREAVRNQQSAVASSYTDIASETDRAKRAEVDVNRYKSFLSETGIEELVNASGLAGNPAFIRAVSAWVGKHGAVVSPAGTPKGGGKLDTKASYMGSPYSKAFMDFVEGNRR